ncbi:MAG: hydrogenase maturation protease [Thermacetogeniaceae bacterium]|nr:HyaD/HybD family hydrogenase maturation endopeptidase [Thermoanaerobacterales bacterium]NLN22290.1 hydrogenase maturation protease [Syntrophomonadaceae bacterium]
MGKKVVLGIGNLLMKDDGVGVHVVKALEKCRLPADVELVDGGTAGCDLLPFMTGAEKIIIIDALKGGGPPGAVYRLRPEDCGKQPINCTITLHDLGILTVLNDLALLEGKTPPCVIIGVEPGEIDWGMELTPEVAAVLPRVLELVQKELTCN